MVFKSKREVETLPYDTEPMSEEGIDLVRIVVAILSEWKVALLTFVVVALAGLVYIRTLKPQYVANATFLPSQGHSAATSLASLFNSGPGPGSLYLGLMHSRSVQDDVLDSTHLLQHWGTQSHEFGRLILGSKSSFSEGPEGIITVSVRDENADLAATIANAYMNSLQNLSDKMAQSSASQARHLLNRQLQEQKNELSQAEQDFIRLQERTGQVAPEAQAATSIGNIAGLRSQITGLQVQLAVARQSEAEGNPDIERLKSQLAQLQAEERKQEAGKAATPVGAPIAAADIPILNLQLAHAREALDTKRATVNSMNSQSSSAQIDAQFSHPVFQVIDRAIPPEFRAWPPQQQYVTAAIGFAFVMSLVAVLAVLVIKRIWRNPEHRANLGRLRRAF